MQLSAVTPDEEPEPLMEETPILAETPFRPVGRFGVRPSTSTPSVYPRPLSFMEELSQKQREMGRSADRPANFGCRPVENPRVSFNFLLLQYRRVQQQFLFHQVNNFHTLIGRGQPGLTSGPTYSGSRTGG